MKFGIFYEHQLPKPWSEGLEEKLFQDALDQVELADRLGIDYAWEVEHHFLEEYSHSSAPEIFLAAASQRTQNIRLGHGIRQVIPSAAVDGAGRAVDGRVGGVRCVRKPNAKGHGEPEKVDWRAHRVRGSQK